MKARKSNNRNESKVTAQNGAAAAKTVTDSCVSPDVVGEIDNHKKVENNSDEKYRELADSLPQTVFEADTEGNLRYVNRYAFEMFGYDIGDFFSGKFHVFDIIAPEDHERVRSDFEQTLCEDNSPADEYLALRKDGSTFPILVHSQRIVREGMTVGMRGILVDITERKRTVRILEENEAKFRTAFMTSMDSFFLATLEDGVLVEMNNAFTDVFGYTREEAVGRTSLELGIFLDPADWAMMLAEVQSKGSIGNRELTGRKKSGEIIICSYSFNTVTIDSTLYILGSARDIGERKLAEEELRQSKDLLNSILRSVPDIIYRLDPQGKVIFVNDAVRNYGYTPDEMFGRDFFEFVCPCDHETATFRVNERRSGDRRTKSLEIRLLRKDQQCADFEIISNVIDNLPVFVLEAEGLYRNHGTQNQVFLGTQGIARDITERKRMEEALRESEARFRAVVDKSNDATIVCDANSKIIYRSPASGRITGYTDEERLGGKAFDIVYPDDVNAVRNVWGQALQHPDGTVRREFRILHKDGNILWVDTIIQNMLDNQNIGAMILTIRDITERKKAEMTLRESEERFRIIYNTSPVSIWEYDCRETFKLLEPLHDIPLDDIKDYFDHNPQMLDSIISSLRLVDVNEETLHMYGAQTKEDIFRAFGKRHTPETKKAIRRAIEAYLKGEEVFKNETVNTRLDGKQINIIVQIAFYEKSKQSGRLILTVTEITGLKQSEAALRESEERYRGIFNSTSDALFIHDENGKIMDVNDRMCEMFGCTHEEALELSISRLSLGQPPYSRAEAEEKIRRSYQEGPQVFEWRSRCLDGTLFWSEVALRACEIAGRKRIIASVRDISDRKRTEVMIKESEAKFRTLFENAGDGILLMEDGLFIDCNPRALKMFGCQSFDQLLGHSPGEFSPPLQPNGRDSGEMAREKIGAALAGNPQFFEWMHRRPDGTFFPVEVSLNKVLLKDRVLLQAIVRDITERRRLEQQFLQAQKMETIGRLAGGVAHDFNNILTVINLISERAMMFMDPSNQNYELFSEIQKAGERAEALTRQLLAFSRRQIIEPRVVDLNKILLGMEKMLRRLIGEDLEFVILPNQALHSALVDPGQIEQVITNLIVNARDAMPGGGKIVIETGNAELDEEYSRSHPDTVPGKYVMCAVSDTGSGMDAETLSKIFEPFFTTKPKGKGTGLGLSTSYGIVKQHHGNIWVYSEPGIGTTFKIYLPIYEDAGTESMEQETTAILKGSENILLVEDDSNIRKELSNIMTQAGYRVTTASNGDEALSVVGKSPQSFHLLVTDVVMPLMGGRELAIHLTGVYPDLRVLFMSGYTDDSIVHQGVLDSGLNFIQKPFTIGNILKKVREVLDTK